MDSERKVAVLFDAENIASKYTPVILNEANALGSVIIRRIYGDWTAREMSSWKQVILDHSIQPIQQYRNVSGKNSSDSALIIDAMDLLYQGRVDTFCIVSSDSDFTRLAARLRESEKFVLGLGEQKTPRPFIAACEKFKYLEALSTVTAPAAKNESPKAAPDLSSKAPVRRTQGDVQELIEAIRSIVEETSDEDGWAYMGDVGNMLNKRYPDFDTRNYGFSKLTPLVGSLQQFDIMSRKTSNPHVTRTFLRNR